MSNPDGRRALAVRISVILRFAVAILIAADSLLFPFSHKPAFAQGRLGKVSKAVRKDDPEPQQSKSKPDKKRKHSNKNHPKHHTKRRRRKDNFHHSSAVSFLIDWGNHDPHHTPHHQPILGHQPDTWVDTPVATVGPPGGDGRVLDAISELSIGDSELPIRDSELPIDIVKNDWFQYQTSKIWANIGTDFDAITIGGLGIQLQAPGSFGVDSSVNTIRESGPGFRTHLWIGDVNLTYEVISSDRLRGRIGIGGNWLNDSIGTVGGLNLTGGIDVKLSDRWNVSAEGNMGDLGDADFLHLGIHLARRFVRNEWTVGFEHFDIGGITIDRWSTGIQFRF